MGGRTPPFVARELRAVYQGDGCCTRCGAGAAGPGANQALRLLEAIEGVTQEHVEVLAEWVALRWADATFNERPCGPDAAFLEMGGPLMAELHVWLQAMLDAKGGGR
mgnify:CR=1 FL=1